jgi:hypothetical protein
MVAGSVCVGIGGAADAASVARIRVGDGAAGVAVGRVVGTAAGVEASDRQPANKTSIITLTYFNGLRFIGLLSP